MLATRAIGILAKAAQFVNDQSGCRRHFSNRNETRQGDTTDWAHLVSLRGRREIWPARATFKASKQCGEAHQRKSVGVLVTVKDREDGGERSVIESSCGQHVTRKPRNSGEIQVLVDELSLYYGGPLVERFQCTPHPFKCSGHRRQMRFTTSTFKVSRISAKMLAIVSVASSSRMAEIGSPWADIPIFFTLWPRVMIKGGSIAREPRPEPGARISANQNSPPLKRDSSSSNRHRALAYCLRMIFSENRCTLFRIMRYKVEYECATARVGAIVIASHLNANALRRSCLLPRDQALV
jgi:hypothetical protein